MRPNQDEAEVEQREEATVDDETSDTSDGPGDGILIASEISLSGLSIESSTSSFVTSSEDDLAISEDIRTSDSFSGMVFITSLISLSKVSSGLKLDREWLSGQNLVVYNDRSVVRFLTTAEFSNFHFVQ